MSTVSTSELTSQAQPKTRRKFRWFRAFLLLFGLVSVLAIIFIMLVPSILSTDAVKRRILAELQPMFQGTVDFEKLSFSWSRGILLDDFRIGNPEGFEDKQAVQIGNARIGVDISSLLFSDEFDAKLILDRPIINVHLRPDGTLNLARLYRSGSGTNKGKADTGADTRVDVTIQKQYKDRDTGLPANVLLSFEIRDGTINFFDEGNDLRQRLFGVNIKADNRNEGRTLALSFDALLDAMDGTRPGKIHMSADLPSRKQPANFRFETSDGIDLAPYAPFLHAVMDRPFESFRGKIRGNISIESDHSLSRWKALGTMTVRDLAIVGGPFGTNKGFRAESMLIHPNVVIELDENWELLSLQLDGTNIDLGFLQINALSFRDSVGMLDKSKSFEHAMGLIVTLDLDELKKNLDVFPEGSFKGKVQASFAAGRPRGPDVTDGFVTFALVLDGKAIAVASDFLPEGTVLPDSFALKANGRVDWKGGNGFASDYDFHVPGLQVTGKLSLDQDRLLTLDMLATLLDKSGKALIAAWLPPGMDLNGDSSLSLKMRLRSGSESSASDAEQPSPPEFSIEGSLELARLSYLGNRLLGLSQEFKLQDRRLEFKTKKAASLNGGPVRLDLTVANLGSDKASFDLVVDWQRGMAEYGLTPVLQYSIPFLAGLPTRDVEKLAGLDFRALAGLNMIIAGPLPKKGDSIMAAMSRLTGSGKVSLENGEFTPSPTLAGLLSLTKSKGKFRFSRIESNFKLENGKIVTTNASVGGSDGVVHYSGSTSLNGNMDYNVDITDLLRKHRDGRRALSIQGGKPIIVKIGGTLTNPKVEGDKIIENLLKNSLEHGIGELIKSIGSGKKPKDALKDLLKKFRGK